MSSPTYVDYGPLLDLIGNWQGDKGEDTAPEPEGAENNPYYESITFEAVGEVTNAEQQVLSTVHYRQVVRRKSNDRVLHDETGYWMWDAKAGIVMHSLTIPRGVCVLAGGGYSGAEDKEGNVIIEVNASDTDPDWKIVQSPFMQDNARTREFHHRVTVGNGRLSYQETTIVEIYDKIFEHTDQNELTLCRD